MIRPERDPHRERDEWKAMAARLAEALRFHEWRSDRHGAALAAFDRKVRGEE